MVEQQDLTLQVECSNHSQAFKERYNYEVGLPRRTIAGDLFYDLKDYFMRTKDQLERKIRFIIQRWEDVGDELNKESVETAIKFAKNHYDEFTIVEPFPDRWCDSVDLVWFYETESVRFSCTASFLPNNVASISGYYRCGEEVQIFNEVLHDADRNKCIKLCSMISL